MKISEISKDTKNIEIIARIEKVILSTGNNGANYLVINLIDNTGRVEARLWNSDETDIKKIKLDAIIRVEATSNIYRQQLQLKINNYEIIEEDYFESYGISQDLFLISAPFNIEKHYQILLNDINKLENDVYKQITISILKDYETEFKSYPAATSVHHNVVGGLFWHSFSLLKSAQNIKEVYKYAEIDWELVYCGVILHDIGKVIELKGKTASEYTNEGKLMGHISIGNTFIAKKAHDLKFDLIQYKDVVKLQHIVLASHGQKEFGSPIEPSLIEAVIVSSLDALDARIYKINDELKKVESFDNWTSRLLTEDGRQFLRHFNKK